MQLGISDLGREIEKGVGKGEERMKQGMSQPTPLKPLENLKKNLSRTSRTAQVDAWARSLAPGADSQWWRAAVAAASAIAAARRAAHPSVSHQQSMAAVREDEEEEEGEEGGGPSGSEGGGSSPAKRRTAVSAAAAAAAAAADLKGEPEALPR
jgi:hypothetical protein